MHLIFGGTFDPVHNGHLRLAVELRERLAVPGVALVPCHITPHREQPGTSSADRLRLLELAVSGEPGLYVDARELQREEASYTADTLRQLRSEVGAQQPIAMVVGTDSFAAFDKWRDWRQIPDLAHIIIVNRPGSELDPDSEPGRLLSARRASDARELRGKPAGLCLQMELPLLAISATGIRERIRSGRSPRYLLPDRVWEEIQVRRLYGLKS